MLAIAKWNLEEVALVVCFELGLTESLDKVDLKDVAAMSRGNAEEHSLGLSGNCRGKSERFKGKMGCGGRAVIVGDLIATRDDAGLGVENGRIGSDLELADNHDVNDGN